MHFVCFFSDTVMFLTSTILEMLVGFGQLFLNNSSSLPGSRSLSFPGQLQVW